MLQVVGPASINLEDGLKQDRGAMRQLNPKTTQYALLTQPIAEKCCKNIMIAQ